jgi:hypothetical protein
VARHLSDQGAMTRLLVFASALTLSAAHIDAQDSQLNLFLFEKTYVALGTPTVIGKPRYYDASIAEPRLLAEAQVVAHAVLHRGMGGQRLHEGLGKTGWNLFLVPQFRLRGVDTNSGPVKSISFMPRFVFQRLRTRGGHSRLRRLGDGLLPRSISSWVITRTGVGRATSETRTHTTAALRLLRNLTRVNESTG